MLRTLFLPLAIAGALAQTPPVKHGSVEGTLIDATAGTPIPNSIVTLRAGSYRSRYLAVTDSNGRFYFPDVEPGEGYQLTADLPGYTSPPATRQSRRDSSSISVAAEQAVRNLAFKVMPLGAISGRVVDEDGEPVPDAEIELSEYRFGPDGRRHLERAMASALADSRGDYRLSGIQPGAYLLRVHVQPIPPVLPAPPEHMHSSIPEEAFTPLYYPSARTPAEATPLEVRAGADIAGIDLRLARAITHHVRGRIVGSGIRLIRLDDTPCGSGGAFLSRSASLNADGTFEASYVLPGAYCLATEPPSPGLTITMKDRDVTGVQVIGIEEPNLTGVLRVEGQAGEFTSAPQIILRGTGYTFRAPVAPNGNFGIKSMIPGVYSLQVVPLPKGLYIKSMQLGDRDVSDGVISIASPEAALTVVLATDPGQINGTVLDSAGKPGDYCAVALTPKTPTPGRPELYPVANTAADGSFHFDAVPPGKYRILAFETAEFQLARSPQFLEEVAGSVEDVTVKPSQTTTVRLKSVDPDTIEKAKAKLP
jgi:protocatechuate 3,4-dioxygenase beta subunit